MDFSVRQLDSTQRKLVFSKSKSSGTYICQQDGKYDIYLGGSETSYSWSSGGFYLEGQNTTKANIKINGKIILNAKFSAPFYEYDGEGNQDGPYYHIATASSEEYLSKGDIITCELYLHETTFVGKRMEWEYNSVEIYFTPYK